MVRKSSEGCRKGSYRLSTASGNLKSEQIGSTNLLVLLILPSCLNMNSTPWNEHPLRANYERHDEATVECIFALASSL